MQGTPVVYCFKVKNTGNVTLTLHSLTDNKLGAILSSQALALAPQASTFITRSATAVITTTNVATWTAYVSATTGLKAVATDSASVNVIPLQPALQFTKTVGLLPANCAPDDSLTVMQGTKVVFCYKVKNTGNVSLTLHSLTDNKLGSILSSQALALAPQASTFITRSATAVITTTNVATWTAYVSATSGLKAMATDSATINVIPLRPAIQFTKTVGSAPSVCAASNSVTLIQGESAIYCYRVRNTGNVSLTLHMLTDSALGSIVAGIPYTLSPGASTFVIHSAAPLITTTNVATWTAYVTASNGLKAEAIDSATVNVIPLRPAIQFTKTVGLAPSTCATGDSLKVMQATKIIYCYKVKNTGNVTLTLHSLTDDKLGAILSSQALALAPQASTFITRSATAVITTTNVATWTAYVTATNGLKAVATDSATVNVIPLRPAIQFTKTVGLAPSTCATGDSLKVMQGKKIVYCYKVKNTGNVTLTLHSLSDNKLGAILSSQALALAPQASTFITRSATAVITTTNIATWTAYISATSGLKAMATDSATINVIPLRPAIQFTKTVGTVKDACAVTSEIAVPGGTTVYYCYSIKNTGNVTLTHHQLTDLNIDQDILPAGFTYDLPPGERVSTVEMGVTISARIDTTTTNTAIWNAYREDNEDVYAVAIAKATVRVRRASISVAKSVGSDRLNCSTSAALVVKPLSSIYYCLMLKNTGSLTLTQHTIKDLALGINRSVNLSIAPGATVVFTRGRLAELGPILVTQDITNTMSAASSYVDGPARVTISATTTALVLIDSDQDTIPDRIEGTDDLDGDSYANHRDTDADGDGVSDQDEAGSDPLHPRQTVTGIPDFLNPFVPNGGVYLPIIQR
jgi:predicted nucleic acid-binding Zn ribbon protein